MNDEPQIRIGTSGWHYDHWIGPFYPEASPSEKMLSFYAARFDTVEVNNTFYQIPDENTLRTWLKTVDDDFLFSVKASRYITHMKKLKDPKDPLSRFFGSIGALDEKIGAVLFQLPPNFGKNSDRLRSFIELLPDKYRYVFEFRDPDWFDEEIYNILKDNNAAFCIYEIEGRESPKQITTDFVYIRLHGPAKRAYQGKYEKEELSGWAGAISTWTNSGKDVYCYFDNDQKGYAAINAMELRDMLIDKNDFKEL